uniref:Exopolyphosphatase n=1 Tax=Candidatus Actinomarina minuta TaxID=1389454 RepID=S5DPA6_9ACTN|nr:exopolyphosphatase [Candidatus Actinomarina minuta]
MVRVAAIDCGSNSTRLLISNVENGRLENLLKQHEVTKLSENLIKTNEIADNSKKRFYKVLRKYLKIIENNNVEEVFCIGTAALRNSKNSDEIIDDVKSKFNLDLKVISGEEEGYLTGIGVQSSFEDLENYLIVDIGGQSTELIYDIDKRVNVDSKEIGVVMMNENFLNQNPISEFDEENAIKFFDQIFSGGDFSSRNFIGVSGTFTSIGSMYLKQKKYNEDEIDRTNISYESINHLYKNLKFQTIPQIINSYPSLDPKRAVTITSGLLLVINLLKKYEINQLKVSKSDILEGLILKYF